MQIQCRNCNRPFAVKKEEVHAALDAIHAEELKYYNTHCAHCGKTNRVTKKQLERAAPGYTPASE